MLRSIVLRAILPYCLAGLLAGIAVGAVAGLFGIGYAAILAVICLIYARYRWKRFIKGLTARINVPLRDIRGKNSTEEAIKAGLGRKGASK